MAIANDNCTVCSKLFIWSKNLLSLLFSLSYFLIYILQSNDNMSVRWETIMVWNLYFNYRQNDYLTTQYLIYYFKRFYNQDRDGSSWEAGVGMVEQGLGMDKFQKEGLGSQYLANRNRHGAGYSYENSISGHDSWLVKTKPICGWNGKNKEWLLIANIL